MKSGTGEDRAVEVSEGIPGRARPAFYRPAPRWHFLAALVAALVLEAEAVAVASLQPRPEIPTDLGGIPEPPPADLILNDLPPEPTPPPDDAPPPLPREPVEPSEFVLEDPTPPPRPQNAPKPPSRVTTQAAVTRPGPVSYITDRSNMLAAPRPSYSYEARRARQTGSGKFVLRFDRNGYVTSVALVQSTGSAILDDLARNSFQRWRCRPGVYEQVYVPITFTLQGAQL